MTENPLISVILPVYNIENYLPVCMDSLFRQTYKNLEFILVDDGSENVCAELCDSYKVVDPRVKVFHKLNGGLSDARNYGFHKAAGQYITFIDPDDYVDQDFIEYLYSLTKTYGTKMAICQHKVIKKDRILFDYGEQGNEVLDDKMCLKRMLYHDVIDTSAWAKLYHRSLCEVIEYPKGKIFEDIGTTYKYFLRSRQIAVGYASKYYYVQHDSSIVNQSFRKNKLDLLEMTDKMAEDVLAVYPDLEQAVLRRRVYARLSTINQMIYTKEFPEIRRDMIRFVRDHKQDICDDPLAPRRDKLAIRLLDLNYNIYKLSWKAYLKVFK